LISDVGLRPGLPPYPSVFSDAPPARVPPPAAVAASGGPSFYNPRTILESAWGVRRRLLKHLCCNPDACSGVVELLEGSYKRVVERFVVVLF